MVYSLKAPNQQKDWAKSLVEAVAYSLINLVLWLWWVWKFIGKPIAELNRFEVSGAAFVVCLVSPTVLALFWYHLRTNQLHRRLGLDHPIPRGWDHFVRNNGEFFVLFHLKNGKMLGGYFGNNSYAATYPHEPDIYVEQ